MVSQHQPSYGFHACNGPFQPLTSHYIEYVLNKNVCLAFLEK